MAPATLLAIHFTDDMMQQDVGRTRLVGTCIIADYRIKTDQRA